MAYIANTPDDVRVMLGAIGLDSLDQLFDMIPPEFRLKRALDVGPALTELELTDHVGGLLARNQGADQRVCFLGGGSYDHFIPAVVDNLAARGEFYTAYTPYQAEASQGTLQATFEYQTLITQLTGMDVSNASLYDGGSAVAEAMLMALTITRRFGRVVVAETVHPEYRQILATFLAHLEPELVTVPAPRGAVDPRPSRPPLTDDTAAVVLQYPNFFGQLEDVEALVEAAHARGRAGDRERRPDQPGPAAPAGRLRRRHRRGRGAGAGQPDVVRRALPGHHGLPRGVPPEDARPDRRPDDRPPRQAVLGADAPDPRAAHPPREGHLEHLHQPGPAGPPRSIYLAAMGPGGLRQAAELSTRKAHYAAERLAAVPGLSLAFPGPFFKEFVVRCAGAIREPCSPRSAASATTAASPWAAGIPTWPTASWSP